MRVAMLTALLAAGLLAGCASTPQEPYWKNTQWITDMAITIESQIRYPTNFKAQNIPVGSAVVQFTYAAGGMRDVQIITSTGDPLLDEDIVTQMSKIALPRPRGADTNIAQRFRITVGVHPPEMAAFFASLDNDIQQHAPHALDLTRASGVVIARFKYRNGKIFDPEISESSGSVILDEAVLNEFRTIQAPPAPAWARDRTMKFSVPIAFCTFGGQCPEIFTHYGTKEVTPNPIRLCANVAFNYTHGTISNVHLTHSSGNAKLDKVALAQIAKGDFPITAQMSQAPTTHFEIPVCYQTGQNAPSPGTVNPPAHASRLGTMDQALRWHGPHAVAERGQAV